MVDTPTKSVLTWRVEEENNGWSKDRINKTLLSVAEAGYKTCFLPNEPRWKDTTGKTQGNRI